MERTTAKQTRVVPTWLDGRAGPNSTMARKQQDNALAAQPA